MSYGIDVGHIVESILTAAFLVGVVYAMIRDMKEKVVDISKEIVELRKVSVTLAENNGRMNLIDERMLAQGKRFDELAKDVKELIRERSVD